MTNLNEELNEIIAKFKEKATEGMPKLKCVLCGKETTNVIMPRPLRPEDLKDNKSFMLWLVRQSLPPIPICENHSKEEIKKRLNLEE